MITEDYVSFETAKLLKEKRFDECCYVKYKYTQQFDEYLQTTEYIYDGFEKYYYPCPTLQMAMKWLREVHKLYVSIIPNPLNYKHQDIQDGWACEVTHLSDLSYDSDYEFFQKKYQTYESACEAAIRYCLQNLI